MGTQMIEIKAFCSSDAELRLGRQALPSLTIFFFLTLFLTTDFSRRPLFASEPVKIQRPIQPEQAHAPSTNGADSLSLSWRNVSLQQAAAQLSHSTGRYLMLDRRINPDEKLALDMTGATLRQVFEAIAIQKGIGFVDLEEIIYLGPGPTCRDLQTLIALREAEITLLPKQKQKTFERSASLSWPRLSEPRALVRKIASRAGKKLLHADRIPHDLWPEGGLPAMSLTRQLTLLLAGFDATFSVSKQGNSIEVVPILTPPKIRRTYAFPQNRLSVVQKFRETLPPETVTIQGHTITLEGRWEDHQHLKALFGTLPTKPGRSHRQVELRQAFTLKVQDQPAGQLIHHLAGKLQLEVDWDRVAIEAAKIRLTRPVSFSVKAANLDELLRAILEPIGLQFVRDENHVRIFPSRP
jgi:hypothetical protein